MHTQKIPETGGYMLTQSEVLENLYRLGGMDRTAFAGIQFDIMPVPKHREDGGVVDAGLCDHTCATEIAVPNYEARAVGKSDAMKRIRTGGCYDCDASAAFHKGTLDTKGLAPLEQLLEWLDRAVAAVRIFHELWIERNFRDHCEEFEIGPVAAAALCQAYEDAKIIELNGFGGSPELHPDIHRFAAEAHCRNLRFNTTTTGRKFLTDEPFIAEFVANPPSVLALSFDDLSPQELEKLLTIGYPDLRKLWQQAMKDEPYHGQRHKAYEGVYAGRMVKILTRNANPPTLVMYNSVIHGGNLDHIPQLVATIARLMPKARLNPYLAQSVFEADPKKRVPCWQPEHLPKLKRTIDWLRDETCAGNPNLTMRLHHYLFLQAQMERFWEEPQELCRRLSGWHGWRGDRRPGAYRYLEISGSGMPWGKTHYPPVEIGRPSRRSVEPLGNKTQAGGHPGSYWYSWLANDRQIHEYSAEDLANRMLYSPADTGSATPDEYQGYIMPRPMFNITSHEAGMDPEIVPHYINLRQKYFGY